ncbi:hypothetical protein BaRGS_00036207, partial [Batillaria attramentaria]
MNTNVPRLFTEGTTRFHVGQGGAATCWFLSAVSTICENRKLLKQDHAGWRLYVALTNRTTLAPVCGTYQQDHAGACMWDLPTGPRWRLYVGLTNRTTLAAVCGTYQQDHAGACMWDLPTGPRWRLYVGLTNRTTLAPMNTNVARLFTEGTTRFHVGQGGAATCWFLSAVSTICENRKLLKQNGFNERDCRIKTLIRDCLHY